MDEANLRCDCGYLQGEGYRNLVDRLAELEAEIERLNQSAEEKVFGSLDQFGK